MNRRKRSPPAEVEIGIRLRPPSSTLTTPSLVRDPDDAAIFHNALHVLYLIADSLLV